MSNNTKDCVVVSLELPNSVSELISDVALFAGISES